MCRLKTIIIRLSFRLHFHKLNACRKYTHTHTYGSYIVIVVHSFNHTVSCLPSIRFNPICSWKKSMVHLLMMYNIQSTYISNEHSWFSFDNFQMKKGKKNKQITIFKQLCIGVCVCAYYLSLVKILEAYCT